MKKSISRILITIVSLIMVATLTACSNSSSTSAPSANNASEPSGKKVNIRIASSSPTVEFSGEGTTSLGISVNYFIKEIEARTNGRITAQVFPDGQIASSTQEYIGGLQNGAFDMGILNCGSWADYTPAFAGLNIPYLYLNYDEAYAVLDSEVGQSWKEIAEKDTKCIILGYFDIGFRQLTCNNAVHAPADLKGIKIRTMPDPIQMATWEALGCAVTPVAYSELYTALQQKMVDAQENPPSNIVSSKVYELQKYMVLTNHNFTATIPAASPVFWNSLSPEDQQLIRDLMIEAQNKGREKTAELAEGFIKFVQEDAGTEVIRLNDEELKAFQDVAKSVWPMVEKQMGSDAYEKLLSFVEQYESGK